MANASSVRAVGLRPAAPAARLSHSQRTSVIASVVRKEGVRKKFMTSAEDRYPSKDRTERLTSSARDRPAPSTPPSTRVRDRFKDEPEPVAPDSSWNGSPSRNGNGVQSVKVEKVEKRVPSPRTSASPRTRRGSPSRFESGIEQLPEVPETSLGVHDITERFMSRARDRPSKSPSKPPAPRIPEPTASFVAAERARSPDPMRLPRSADRTVTRGRVKDRFMDPPAPTTPTLPPPPPPMKQQAQSYAAPTRVASRTPSPLRKRRVGPTAQRLALISQEQTKEANQPVPSPSYIDVEAIPDTSFWGNLPSLKGIPLFDYMSYDGAGPETINGRVAMLGFFSMLCTEFVTGEGCLEQYVYTADSLPYMFVIWTLASMAPMLRGVDIEKASWGPFTPMAEKLNGRAAMVGLVGVVIFEALKGRALFF